MSEPEIQPEIQSHQRMFRTAPHVFVLGRWLGWLAQAESLTQPAEYEYQFQPEPVHLRDGRVAYLVSCL